MKILGEILLKPWRSTACYYSDVLKRLSYPLIVVIIMVMKSFESDKVGKQPISQTMLQSVRTMGEFKGSQALYARQTPHVLIFSTWP